jgi:hypothetical protein
MEASEVGGEEYTDIGMDRSSSTLRSRNTAVTHFNRFLQEIKYRDSNKKSKLNYMDMEIDDFSSALFGKFADFLFRSATNIKSSGTALENTSMKYYKIYLHLGFH